MRYDSLPSPALLFLNICKKLKQLNGIINARFREAPRSVCLLQSSPHSRSRILFWQSQYGITDTFRTLIITTHISFYHSSIQKIHHSHEISSGDLGSTFFDVLLRITARDGLVLVRGASDPLDRLHDLTLRSKEGTDTDQAVSIGREQGF